MSYSQKCIENYAIKVRKNKPKKKNWPAKWLFAWVKSKNNNNNNTIAKKLRKRFDEWSALLWWRYYYLISRVKCWSANMSRNQTTEWRKIVFQADTQTSVSAYIKHKNRIIRKWTLFNSSKKRLIAKKEATKKKWGEHKANEAYK